MRQNLAFLDLLTASPSTIYNNAGLGTTPFKFAAPTASSFALTRLLQVTNKHATNYLAFYPSATTGSPTFVASATGVIAATEGINVGPGASYFLNLKGDVDLWLVASAVSTPIQVVAYDKAVR